MTRLLVAVIGMHMYTGASAALEAPVGNNSVKSSAIDSFFRGHDCKGEDGAAGCPAQSRNGVNETVKAQRSKRCP